VGDEAPQPVADAVDTTRSVTIEDVAVAAHVSTATVSRVMNNRLVVAEETRERVLAAIERLRFRPSSLGRNLATRRTGTIGLVIADITNPFYPEVVRGVEQAASSYDMSLLLYDTAEDSEREAQALRLLGERHVDGVIICASRLSEERLTMLARVDTPLVFINRRPTVPSIGTVDVDQEVGVRAAVAHLSALGHRRIAYIGGPEQSQVQQRRLGAFTGACAERGIAVPASSIVAASPTILGGKDAARQLLHGDTTRPTAILAYNDLIAIGVIMAAREDGIAVPGELSIVGHDDIPLAGVLQPPLTTVRQPMRELGARAVELLYARLQPGAAPSPAPALIRLTPTLMARASTGPAPTQPTPRCHTA